MADYYVDDNGKITKKKKKNQPSYSVDLEGNVTKMEQEIDEELAPVKPTTKQEEERTWFQSGALGEGWSWENLGKTVLGTITDTAEHFSSGIIGMGEKIYDAMLTLSPYMLQGQINQMGGYNMELQKLHDYAGNELKAEVAEEVKKDLYDEEKIAQNIITKPVKNATGVDAETDSVLGEKSDSLVQSAGQLAATAVTSPVVPWWLTTGATSFGAEAENALKKGASHEEATISAAITAGAEILTEKISGGIKFGGKTLDEGLTKALSEAITNKTVNTLVKIGVDATGEGFEEVLSGALSAVGQRITYDDDKDISLDELFLSEEAFESFIGGFVLGGGSSTIGAIKSNISSSKDTTSLTDTEKTVVEKEVEKRIAEEEKNGKKLTAKEKTKIQDEVLAQMEKGYISTDSIEEALGGDTYKAYRDTVNNEEALQNEYDTLYKMKNGEKSDEQIDRQAELKKQLDELKSTDKRNQLKQKLNDEVFTLAKGTRLAESYNEKTRRSQAFEADVSKYDAKQQEIIKKAVDSGILNNTNRTHEFVDIVAKISADKGVLFDFSNNAKLKESGFAIEGKTVNGFATKDGITLNMDSAKAWQSVVGHEITHVLEGTEVYTEFQSMLFEYAKTKGEYDSRLADITALYKDIKDADINAELTADLVGDYLFMDENFVKTLSTKHRNLFQKIYDEIKYLVKVATSGSKEARDLAKIERTFEKLYREGGKAQTDTKYSLESVDGTDYVKAEKNLFVKEDGTPATQKEIFNSLVGKTISLPDGDVKIVKRLPNKDMYNELAKRYPKNLDGVTDVKKLNSDVNTNMEELLSNSEMEDANVPDYNGRHARQGITSFDTRTVKFYDGESAYDVGFSIATLENGEKIAYAKKYYGYDAELTQKIQAAEVRSQKSPLNQQPVLRGNALNEGVQYSNISDSSDNSISQNSEKSSGEVKNSLSAEQQEYFKDSKVRDENGNLMVMYHGTPNGEFTVFRDGTYFTANKEYADKYQNPSASSINSRKVATSPKTFEVYLNITKPFDISDPEARNIYINNYIKGGNAVGINPYLSDAEYAKIDTVDWTEGEDLREFLVENGYDYDGLVLDEGAVGGYGEDVEHRGTSYVVFSPEQVKSIDNQNPTSDPDIRFSLSEAVEETNELMALHNLHTNEVLKQLEMGGLPYPSVAITKPEMIAHDNFGEVTLILQKDAVDPKKSKYNKVYGADAYTPTFPQIDYEASEQAAEKISSKVKELFGKIPEDYQRTLRSLRDYTNIDDELNRAGGEQRLIERYEDDYGMKQLYLAEKDQAVPTEIKRTETPITEVQREEYQFIVDKMGAEVFASFRSRDGYTSPMTARKQWFENHGERFKAVYGEWLAGDPNLTETDVAEIIQETPDPWFMSEARRVVEFTENGGVAVKEETDYRATEAKIDEKIAGSDYKQWLNDFFSGIEGRSGLRNEKDRFTPSGNRRSFSQLHDPVTVDNIVKIMRKENQKGQGAFGTGNIQGASAKEYGSIAEVKKNADRLGKMTQEEHDQINEQINNTMYDIASRYANGKDIIDAKTTLVEAVAQSESKEGIARYLKQFDYVYKYTDAIGEDLLALRDYIRTLPTPYFEAKPQRAVGFDEIGVFVIPNNADIKLKQELLNRGYSIAEYDPTIEGHRQKVVNSFEEYKFSLSDVGNTAANRGTALRDLRLETAQEDIAPVVETAPETVARNTVRTEEYAPITEEEATLRDADIPLPGEADAPPEMAAPFYGEEGEQAAPADPFEDRDIKEVGNRKVKAYMFENPEVKPFFQSEANVMLGELRDTIKGEKFYTETETGSFWTGTSRYTSDDIAYLRDALKLSYADIEKGLNAIIEDNGKENIAAAKRIEFVLSDRLSKGYTDLTTGMKIPPNEEYLNVLREKEAIEYSAEAGQSIFENADMYAPPVEEDIPAVEEAATEEAPVAENIAPLQENATIEEDEIKPIKTVRDRFEAKLRNLKTELANNISLREESKINFDEQIANLQAEYDAKKNKNTMTANNILRRIERAKRLKNNTDADFEKRISDLGARIEKMNSKDFQTVVNRMSKQEELKALVEKIVGDTSAWVDKKLGISYKVNTLRRNLRDIVRDENGNRDIQKADAIYDELQGKYNSHEAELNREATKIKQSFADMKINKYEDVYIQMLGEFRHNPDTTLTEDVVKDYYEKHKNKIDTTKVDKAIEMARETYDSLFQRVNAVLREQGMKELHYRKGYFPHFTEEHQGFLAKLLNWKIRNDEIPTDIAGMTEEFNPNRSWQSFNKERKTDITDYSFTKGLDTYSQGALDWIYHIEDIQKRRAFENHIRYTHSEKGVQERIDKILASEEFDAEEMQEQIDLVYKEAGNPLNNFVTDFRAGTNTLASKKSSVDRGMEELTNRKFYSTMTNISSRVTANMVVGSVSATLTNFIPITQSWGQVSPFSSLRAMGDTIRSTFRDDGMINKSDFLTNRLRKAEALHKTTWDKAIEKIAIPAEAVDSFTSQTVWRSKYLENISNGMSESAAIKDADQFAENVIAGRSRGNMPTIFDSKNPLVKTFTAFQLEVANQYGYMFKDMPQDVKDHQVGKLVKGYTTMFLGAYAYNALYSALVGRDVAFDPIGIIEDLLRDLGLFGDDEEEEDVLDILANTTENVLEQVPFVGGLLGGGRVPISAALPYGEGIPEMFKGYAEDIADGNLGNIFKESLNPLYYLALPVGGGQIKKTVQGLSMFDEDHPIAGSYTDSGNLRFPVEDTLANRVQAGIFGQWASENARDYFDNERKPLETKQIEEFMSSGMNIQDYWEYREGLSEYDKLAEKADYINGLDLPVETKNLLINNIANRKEPIDMTDYDSYSSFEEFDYATKNPEKYDFLIENNISYDEYKSFDDETKDAYSWAYENPESYTLSKAVSDDVVEYRRYVKALNDITADKDEDGDSISGSRKTKVIEYINTLNADYGAKLILFKSEYKADDTYNYEIVEYLNNRKDISYSEMETILTKLGFTVSPDGDITW